MSNLFAVAMYVLQAIALYSIAQRRGIKNPWLAWIPFGSAWILGCLYDDYKARSGKRTKFRVAQLALSIGTVVLAVAVMLVSFSAMLTIMDRDALEELFDIYGQIAFVDGNDLYAPSEEEIVEQLTALLDKPITDQQADALLGKAAVILVLAFAVLAAGIAAAVIECMCMYSIFESCDPSTKLVFFLVGLFVGLWPVFLFVVRNKDLGLPQGLPGGFERTPPQEPWEA